MCHVFGFCRLSIAEEHVETACVPDNVQDIQVICRAPLSICSKLRQKVLSAGDIDEMER